MIKILIPELEKHRNETTFRPYLLAKNMFEDVGIRFVTSGDHDIVWIGQASFLNKGLSLEQSSEIGYNFCKQFDAPVILVDGQDSHSLIGTSEVVSKLIDSGKSPAMVLKNTLLEKDKYSNGYFTGRLYWGPGDYKPDPRAVNITQLSGTNWLSTVKMDFSQRHNILKVVDVSAMFSYGNMDGTEHGVRHSEAYSSFRSRCITNLSLSKSLKVNMVSPGQRYPEDRYFNMMAEGKVIVAPFGYGEIAPRDIHAAMMNSILVKPSMNHLKSEPWVYEDGITYFACKHDYSDVVDVVEYVLSDYKNLRDMSVESMIKYFNERYSHERVVMYIYNLLSNLDFVSHE